MEIAVTVRSPTKASAAAHRAVERPHREESPLLDEDSSSSAPVIEAKEDTWFLIVCVLLVASGPFSFGYSLGYTSPALAQLREDLHISRNEASFFGALVNLGAMAGAIVSGNVADRLGRRGAFVVAAVPGALGWLLVASAQALTTLYLGRFLTGFATGVISFSVPVFISEVSPGRLRGGLGAINQLGITIGIMMVYALGLPLSWRALAATGMAPLVILVGAAAFVPETPRWLAKNGSSDALVRSLRKLRGPQADIATEMREIQDAVVASQSQPRATLSDLCAANLTRPLLIGIGLMVLQQFSGVNAVMFYSGDIFRTAGITSSNAAAFSVGLLQVGMTCIAAWLLDRAGRRPLLMVSAGGMAASCVALGYSFYLKSQSLAVAESGGSGVAGAIALVSTLTYVAAFSMGVGAIPWIIMSEVFPVHVRGLAGSVAVLVNWSCSFFVTQTFQALLDYSSPGAFWLYGAECAFTVFFVYKFVPETRGRTLEEIEASFKLL